MVNWFSPIGIDTPVNEIVFSYYNRPISYGYNMPIFGFRNYYAPYGYSQCRGLFDNYPQKFCYYGGVQKKFSYQSDCVKENKPAVKSEVKISDNVDLRKDFADIAQSYSNCKESDKSHLKFCINDGCKHDPKSKEWCADFVTYVVKEAYRNKGKTVPQGFGSHDVKTMKEWAVNKGYFLKTAGMTNKADIIKQKVKVGDIVIFNEPKADGTLASHTGIVKEIDYDNGKFKTIEGNKDDRVGTGEYSPNYAQLSGFIQLS